MKIARILSVLIVLAVMALAQPQAAPTLAQEDDACAQFSSLSGTYDGGQRIALGTAQPGDVFTVVATLGEAEFANVVIVGNTSGLVLTGAASVPVTLTYTVPEAGLPAGVTGVGIATGVGPEGAVFNVTASCERPAPKPEPEEENVPGCDMLPLTQGAAVGAFVSDALLYAEPGVASYPALTLPAGKTAWVLGVDKSGQYYKIKWVCGYLWVKKATMGPNDDAVWQGHALPQDVVQ